MPHSRYHTNQHTVMTGYDRSPDNLTICFRRFVQRRFFCIITISLSCLLADLRLPGRPENRCGT